MRVSFIPYVQGRNDYPDGDGLKFGLAFHNTSNDASDSGEASYATRRTDGIGSHFYVDKDSATQSIDTRDRVGHAGSREGNENAVCFELTGSNGWTRAQWLANIEWNLLGRVAAAVIRAHWPDGSFQVRRASVAEMKANPKIKAMYGHDDMRRAWGGTTHTDPGPNFPWDHLVNVIKAALGEDDEMAYNEAQMRAFAWQYAGRGIASNDETPEGNMSTLAVLDTIYRTVLEIAKRVDIGPEELAQIQERAKIAAAAALAETADDFADAVVGRLDPNVTLTPDTIKQALRDVLLHGAAPAQP